MKLTVTFRDLSDKCWQEACELLGLNYYCMNEGRASPDDEITLTEEQARELGFIK